MTDWNTVTSASATGLDNSPRKKVTLAPTEPGQPQPKTQRTPGRTRTH